MTWLAPVAAVGLAHGGCGAEDPRELFVRPFDAGTEEDATNERAPEVDPTLGGPCTEDKQCDDTIPCTADSCDKALLRCRNVPDDTQCADPSHCNGLEKCVLRLGCAPGPVVTCQDGNPCSIDRCIEATKGCEHLTRDVDGDGDPDYHCEGMRDCDDLDPSVSSKLPEVCGNFKDDNCNGVVDEAACTAPANDVCATALAVSAPGTYPMTTVAATRDYITKCTVKSPTAAKDVVIRVTVPPGDPKDIEIWATAQVTTNEVAVALRTDCALAATELGCDGVAATRPSARRIVRGALPGTTVAAIVTTQMPGAVDVKVDFRTATTPPANESCAAPQPVDIDTQFTARIIDPEKDLESDCDKAKTGELTYTFTLPGVTPLDVKIFASTLVGSGQPVVSLRDTATSCSNELRCRVGSAPVLFARGLAPGVPHVFTVAGTSQLDASILVKTSPATTPPDNQSCTTAPLLDFLPVTGSRQANLTVDLSKQEDAIKNGCLAGGPAAAYRLELTEPSDVLVIGRFASNESGSVSINKPGCTKADLEVPCTMGATPQRVSARNVKAGSYRIVIADELGQSAQLSVLVRPYQPPTSVGASDNCVTPFTLPSGGGFFTGDTTNSVADFNAGCDAPGQPFGSAKDQIMKLDVAQKQRVVFDMTGSVFTTLLDIRKGTTCAGANEVSGACFVGFSASKSFLDLTLDPGTYWVQVDGYNGDRGPWFLDLRVLAP
jgi:hypothetical protein